MMIVSNDGDRVFFTESDTVLEVTQDSIFLFAHKIGHSDYPEIVASSRYSHNLRLMLDAIKDAYNDGERVCDLSELWDEE